LSFIGIDFVPDAFVGGPVRPAAVLYSLEGDFGFSPENATSPAPVIGHEVKLINFNLQTLRVTRVDHRVETANNVTDALPDSG
jgi:hypothetical protein